MSKVILNNIDHQELRVDLRKSAALGDGVAGCLVVPKEFAEVQKNYPILFQKDESTGAFQAVALFGFFENENLFLTEKGWEASYVPAVMEREPFLIGLPENPDDSTSLMLQIDLEHPRVSRTEVGERLFLEHGGRSPYLSHIVNILLLIHEGLKESQEFFEALLKLDLIEKIKLDIQFRDGQHLLAENYYTIKQEAFLNLPDDVLVYLFRSGYVFYVNMVISSLGNIKKLVRMRNLLN